LLWEAIAPKDANYYGKLKKAASLPDRQKIDRKSRSYHQLVRYKFAGIYTGGARLFREWEKKLSVKTGEGTTTVVSVKQGTLSKATAHWLVADR